MSHTNTEADNRARRPVIQFHSGHGHHSDLSDRPGAEVAFRCDSEESKGENDDQENAKQSIEGSARYLCKFQEGWRVFCGGGYEFGLQIGEIRL